MADAGHREGGCLCGAVRYRAAEPLRPITICHCSECRGTSGGAPAHSACAADGFELLRGETLRWFAGPTSETGGERGFCATCGAYVLFRIEGDELMYMTAGSLDDASGIPFEAHIFWASRAPWEAPDGRPALERYA